MKFGTGNRPFSINLMKSKNFRFAVQLHLKPLSLFVNIYFYFFVTYPTFSVSSFTLRSALRKGVVSYFQAIFTYLYTVLNIFMSYC
jgi:hypothetical protein